ncbi:MAG: c-type cytochrome [Acetobacteraceae bacterium]
MTRHPAGRPFISICLAVALSAFSLMARADDATVARGKYLVTISGCSDCHTPGYFIGHPEMARYLGGSNVGFAIPGLGVFVAPNLTPDKETGLGNWTPEQIVTAITTGVRPDGRVLVPIMPWQSFAHLTPADAMAIAEYLESLPPVRNKVAGPFGTSTVPNVLVMAVLPGELYATLPKPKPPSRE